jgi:hypothetical protein
MSIIFILLILLGVLFLVVLVLGFLLPNSWRVDREILIQAEAESIFPLINSPKNWQEWSVWNIDNGMKISLSGPSTAKDASMSWKGNQINGKMTVTKSENNRTVELLMDLENGRFLVNCTIVIDGSVPNFSQVAWRSELNMSKNYNPVSRYQAYFLKNYFDTSMSESLNGLKALFPDEEISEEEFS